MGLAERCYAIWRASFHGSGAVVASSRAAQAWLDDAMALKGGAQRRDRSDGYRRNQGRRGEARRADGGALAGPQGGGARPRLDAGRAGTLPAMSIARFDKGVSGAVKVSTRG
jgi:hypothetical protein